MNPETAASALTADKLTKSYDSFVAVDGISFSIRPGECFGILGPNGAGKTTTVKMISGVSAPTAGRLDVLGFDPARQPRALKAAIGVVPDENNLDIDLSVQANLEVYAGFFNFPRAAAKTKSQELLRFVGLEDKAKLAVDELSNGMKRRLLLARALLNDPRLLILDEPTAALDPSIRHQLWEKMRDLKARGMTQILTTHYMDEAAKMCDRLIIMDRGHIVELGEPAALVNKHNQPDLEAVFLKLTGRKLANGSD
jgi:lipooligosaccharide transport system ATP-binding protein